MRTSIIIPTCPGNEEMLKESVASVMRTVKEDFELIIVRNDYAGFARAVNRGLICARENPEIDGVAIINDDAIMKPGWLEALKSKARQDSSIVGDLRSFRGDHVAFFMVYLRKSVIDVIGLLDERFLYGNCEDVDYCIRAQDAGFLLSFVPGILCHHRGSHTLNKLMEDPEKSAEVEKNKERFTKKWKGTKWERRADGGAWFDNN